MVYTERAEMAAVSCGTSHASDVSTPLRWIFHKKRKEIKKLFTHVESHVSAMSLLESGEKRYIKVINNSSILPRSLSVTSYTKNTHTFSRRGEGRGEEGEGLES